MNRVEMTGWDRKRETIREGLDAVEFDWSQPTMFSWLGVTAYLTIDAIEAVLRTVASAALGSEMVLTYCATEAFLNEFGRELALVERCGLKIVEHPSHDDVYEHQFRPPRRWLDLHTYERLIATVAAG